MPPAHISGTLTASCPPVPVYPPREFTSPCLLLPCIHGALTRFLAAWRVIRGVHRIRCLCPCDPGRAPLLPPVPVYPGRSSLDPHGCVSRTARRLLCKPRTLAWLPSRRLQGASVIRSPPASCFPLPFFPDIPAVRSASPLRHSADGRRNRRLGPAAEPPEPQPSPDAVLTDLPCRQIPAFLPGSASRACAARLSGALILLPAASGRTPAGRCISDQPRHLGAQIALPAAAS